MYKNRGYDIAIKGKARYFKFVQEQPSVWEPAPYAMRLTKERQTQPGMHKDQFIEGLDERILVLGGR
jgi:hypothetical protein